MAWSDGVFVGERAQVVRLFFSHRLFLSRPRRALDILFFTLFSWWGIWLE